MLMGSMIFDNERVLCVNFYYTKSYILYKKILTDNRFDMYNNNRDYVFTYSKKQ